MIDLFKIKEFLKPDYSPQEKFLSCISPITILKNINRINLLIWGFYFRYIIRDKRR